jgi:hypothetical protein
MKPNNGLGFANLETPKIIKRSEEKKAQIQYRF